MKKVAVILGSDSDIEKIESCVEVLREFGVPYEVDVISAHRSPQRARDFALNARKNGFGVIIAGAGGAAHLPGVLASMTILPVIGVPVSGKLSGLDSLLSIVQMPPGVPVATVGVDAGRNAGLLAIQILAHSDEQLQRKLEKYRTKLAEETESKAVRARKELQP